VRSLTHPRHYLSGESFAKEQCLLFERLWQFITLKPLVSQHNAFVTRRLCGILIVVQNFDGKIRAFENVCLHRQSALQWETEGKRPLVCRYHAWAYNVRGEPENIPLCDELYRLTTAERENLRLREFPLEIIGNLIFIHPGADPLPIAEQFSPQFLQSLRESSERYDDEVMLTTIHARYNWKLAYENLRDSNHPRFIHERTLAKVVSFAPSVNEDLAGEGKRLNARREPLARDAAMDLLRRFSWGGPDAALDQFPSLAWHENVERWGIDDAYYNWLAFPNLHIASATGGFSFIIEHHIPVSADRTDLEIHCLTARKRKPYAWSTAVLHSHMIGAHSVLAEDIKVMEMVQSGMHMDVPRAVLGDYEGMNLLVDKWYADLMEERFAL